MDALQWIITVVVSLVSGTVGGVALAPWLSMRTEQGRRRLEAETTIRGVLRTYRDQMKYRHSEVVIRQNYPPDYVSMESQERLAEAVLRELPNLPKKLQDRLRRHLTVLVGRWTVDFGEARAFLPDGFRSDVSEKAWLNKRLAEIVASDDTAALDHGLLGCVRKDVTDPNAYDSAEQALSDMIDIMPTRRAVIVSPRKLQAHRSQRKEIEDRLKALESGTGSP